MLHDILTAVRRGRPAKSKHTPAWCLSAVHIRISAYLPFRWYNGPEALGRRGEIAWAMLRRALPRIPSPTLSFALQAFIL